MLLEREKKGLRQVTRRSTIFWPQPGVPSLSTPLQGKGADKGGERPCVRVWWRIGARVICSGVKRLRGLGIAGASDGVAV